ncbi:LuxR family two component transcriptional regulator [Flavobacterium aquaticum]|uniref:LuxR family two component transcriptional regulator n=1 Tax=Flavobacterium aquaticum TaxID=1236486 RepID=A0A327YFI1_9FLAO|nr:response regulator transcription factor [Flavobacterium aquaticum]RAK19818.1 LuxR family two component transcriptional regulator [Flavobacterium aquaticum]
MEEQCEFNFIVADDHTIVRQGVTFILKEIHKNSCVYQLANFSEIIKRLNTTPIDLLVLDISFPDGTSLNIIPTIKKIQPNIKILIFSAFDENIYAIRYLNAGASGYLSKLSNEDEIKLAIKSVLNSGKYISKNIQEKIMDTYIFKKPKNPLEQLSNREIEIAKLLVEGFSNIDICNTLNIQKSTVSTYKNRIFEKLDVDNLSSLIQIFNFYKDKKE